MRVLQRATAAATRLAGGLLIAAAAGAAAQTWRPPRAAKAASALLAGHGISGPWDMTPLTAGPPRNCSPKLLH